MVTIKNNDIWTEALANASGFPILDGNTEVFGHGQKVIDDWLNDAPDQIKALFYGFYNRIKLSIGTGLSVNYSGGSVLTPTGIVNFSPGSINVPPSSASYVFISKNGVVQQASSLPNEGVALGLVSSGASTVSQISDLRYQVLEQVKTLSLPAQASPYLSGDIKPTFRTSVEDGFLACNGASYLRTAYPDLFAAIGTQFNQVGDSNLNFRVPDLRGQTLVGSSTARPIGARFGAETVSLSVSQMPLHNHSTTQNSHSHVLNQIPHSHGLNDPGHAHGVFDPGHRHHLVIPAFGSDSNGGRLVDGSGPAGAPDYHYDTETSGSNIGIYGNGTGISLNAANANANIQANTIDISVNANGGNAPVSVLQPSVSCNYLIKT